MKTSACARWALVALLAGCGGKAVVDGTAAEGGGGATSSGPTSTTTTITTIPTTTTTTTATTTTTCTDHAQCPGGLCVFSTGLCSSACSSWEPCGTGWFCDPCGTSSCPQCYDCLSVCVPASNGQCDDHDDCGSSDLCIYWQQRCAPPCDDEGGCADPSLYCEFCATASCPMCEDCVAACVGYEWD